MESNIIEINFTQKILETYSKINILVTRINNLMVKTGLNYTMHAEEAANKIFKLADTKVELITLKAIVEETLNKIDDTSCKLLILRYIDKVKCNEIANVLNISERTFFRKTKKACTSFYTVIKTHNAVLEQLQKSNIINLNFNLGLSL
jgi:DNA-directed RNA polymerase specialized sigma subunit